MIVDRGVVQAALPGYELGRQLGRGAFGLVLAGRDRLRRDVAIKVLPGVARDDGPDRADAETEALVLARLDHPHVVRVYDYLEHDELALIVMEQLGGGSLRARAAQGLRIEAACAVGLAAAAGLGYAHDQGVLHRDVKPENILFAADGRPKVADFGVAKVLARTAELPSRVIGTPRYMAPEQFQLEELRPATDLYALGLVLYELLTGRPAFPPEPDRPTSPRLARLYQTPPPMPGVPAPIGAVVIRVLAARVRDRQHTAETFAVDLARAANDSLGPGWLAGARIPVQLDEHLRSVVAGSAASGRRRAGPVTPTSAGPALPTPVGPGPPPPVGPDRPAPPVDEDLDVLTDLLATVVPAPASPVPPPPMPAPPRPSSPTPPAPVVPTPAALVNSEAVTLAGAGTLAPGRRGRLSPPAPPSAARPVPVPAFTPARRPADGDDGSGPLVMRPRDDVEYRRSSRRVAFLALALVGLVAFVTVAFVFLA